MRLFWLAALMLTTTGLGAQEIYRSVDSDGHPIYSDRPHGDDAQPISVLAPRPSTPAASPPAAEPRPAPSTDSVEPRLAGEIEREPTAEERARACESARERLQMYMNARRLFRELPDGEREYLDSDEIERARANAAANVETWCG